MKKTVLLIVMILMTIAVIAQPRMGGGRMGGGGMPMGMPMMENQLSGLPDFEAIAQKQAQDLQQKLGLDDKQTKKVRDLIKSEGEDRANIQIAYNRSAMIQAMFEEGEELSDDDREMKKELDKMEAKYDSKYQKLLSAEQYTGWKEFNKQLKAEQAEAMKNIKDNFGEGMPPMGPGGPMGGGPMGGGPRGGMRGGF